MKLSKATSEKQSRAALLYSDEDMVADSQLPDGPNFDLRIGPSSGGFTSEPLPDYPPSLIDGTHARALANIALVGVAAGGGAYTAGSGPSSVPIGIGAAASVAPSNCTGSNCHFSD